MSKRNTALNHLMNTADTLARLEAERASMAAARLAVLRQAILNAGLTQHDVAAAGGLDQGSLSRWLSGKSQPSTENTYALCRAIERAVKTRQETD